MYSKGKIYVASDMWTHKEKHYTLMFVTKVIQLCSLMDQLFKALSIHFSLLSCVSVFSHGYWTVHITYMDHVSNMIGYMGNHFINYLYRKLYNIRVHQNRQEV
jgi:hypothetical protein